MRLVIEIVISFDGYVSTFFLHWSLSISLSISDSLLIISPSPFFFGFHTNSLSIFKSSSCHLFLSSIYTSACSDLFFFWEENENSLTQREEYNRAENRAKQQSWNRVNISQKLTEAGNLNTTENHLCTLPILDLGVSKLVTPHFCTLPTFLYYSLHGNNN